MKKYGDELFIYAMAQREVDEAEQAENEQNEKQGGDPKKDKK